MENYLLGSLKHYWHLVTRIGVLEDDSYSEGRRVILSNEIALFGFITPLLYNLFYALYDLQLLLAPIAVNFIGSCVCLSVFWLNRKQKRLIAKYVITLSPNIQIFLLTYFLSTATGMHLLHIMMISFVMFLFSNQSRAQIALNVFVPVTLYVYSFFMFTPDSSPIVLNANILVFLYIAISITVFMLVMVFFVLFYREIDITERLLEHEHERSEKLLLSILPDEIAQKLKDEPGTIAEEFSSVTILFADIVGFTQIAASTSPNRLVEVLNSIFSEFDRLVDKYELEKIKTIGDAYMVAGGIPTPTDDHIKKMAHLALDMLRIVPRFKFDNTPLEVRVGFHTGSVIAGVIGEKKFSYDIWGEAVNFASRLESHSDNGKIHVSEQVYAALKDEFMFQSRGKTNIKGIGSVESYYLISN